MLQFEILNFTLLNSSTLKATADLLFENQITVCGVKVISKNDKTLFVAMPTKKAGNKYKPDILIVDRQLKANIQRQMLQRYTQYTTPENQAEKQSKG